MPFRRVPLVLLLLSSVVWLVCGLAFVLIQVGDVVGVCDALGGSNNLGTGHYQMWPPGRECVYTPDELPPVDLNTGHAVPLVIPVRPETGLALAMLVAFPVGVASSLSLRRRTGTAA